MLPDDGGDREPLAVRTYERLAEFRFASLLVRMALMLVFSKSKADVPFGCRRSITSLKAIVLPLKIFTSSTLPYSLSSNVSSSAISLKLLLLASCGPKFSMPALISLID